MVHSNNSLSVFDHFVKLALNGLNHHFQQAVLIRGLHILHILHIEKRYKETLILYIFVKLALKAND